MKRFLALLLTASMLSGFAVPASAATAPKYPVSGISNDGYLADEDNDSRVDMSSSVNRVPYGETVYFPLLSDGSGAVAELEKSASDAKKAAEAAKTTHTGLVNDYNTKKTAWNKAVGDHKTAKEAYDRAVAAGGNKGELERLKNEANQKWEAAKTTLSKTPVVTDAQLSTKRADKNAADSAKKEATLLYSDVTQKQTTYDNTPPLLDSGVPKAAALRALNDAKLVWNNTKARKGWSNLGSTDAAIIVALEQKFDTLNNEYNAMVPKNTAYNTAVQKEKETHEAFVTAEAKWNNAPDLTKMEQNVKRLFDAIAPAKSAMDKAEALQSTTSSAYKAMKEKEAAAATAKQKYDEAKGNRFPYVYESDAASKAKVSSTKWEESSSYVGSPDIVKKRVSDDSDIPGVSNGSNYIYFVAVPVKERSSTDSRDLIGRIVVKQTSGIKWEHNLDISVELGYEDAEDSDEGEDTITKKPITFKKSTFSDGGDYTFYFEADPDCSFVVNVSGQPSITLSFDIEPISRLDDKIYKAYPNADTAYYNGNYASFNRTGTLYLAPPDGEDDYYVYAVDDRNNLSRVDAKWNSSEDAYEINTRILGRYLLSSERLSNSFLSTGSASSSSKPSSGSSSSSGNASGDLVVVPAPSSSTPSTSYTPPVTRPSSSAAPSSSSQASSSSEQSSSEESSSEESSEPEEESSEPEDIIDVDTDGDDTDGPKKGGSSLIWILVIVGLLAAGGAVGFVIYNNKIKRDDGYSQYDDYDDDDDFPEDDDK